MMRIMRDVLGGRRLCIIEVEERACEGDDMMW